MVRAGLGGSWKCLFANDFDETKAQSYAANWGDGELWVGDVAAITPDRLRGTADLAWASFPCQDLSLAGNGAGLKGTRSGTFWSFWKHIRALRNAGRLPRIIALENVCGALTSNGGADFSAIIAAFVECDYHVGAVVIDAIDFVPQSRPRLFIVGVRGDLAVPKSLVADRHLGKWHPSRLVEAHHKLAAPAKARWLWWKLPFPAHRTSSLADLIDHEPAGVPWHSEAETDKLLRMMSESNLKKVAAARLARKFMVGAIYKRTRPDGPDQSRVQRAEVRFDDVAGCLRTPAGGSSRQILLIVNGNETRSRLLSPREAARLMGLGEQYKLPDRYNDAYHLAGDGVAVPVVGFLAKNIFEPLLQGQHASNEKAA